MMNRDIEDLGDSMWISVTFSELSFLLFTALFNLLILSFLVCKRLDSNVQ